MAPRATLLLLLSALLAGCDAAGQVGGAFLGANVAAIPVIQRDLPDAAISIMSGRDCSVVRLDQGKSYCKPLEPLPTPPPYCTSSLGTVDCWFDTSGLGHPAPRGTADGPYGLTPLQNADRTKHWGLLF